MVHVHESETGLVPSAYPELSGSNHKASGYVDTLPFGSQHVLQVVHKKTDPLLFRQPPSSWFIPKSHTISKQMQRFVYVGAQKRLPSSFASRVCLFL